MSIHQTAVVDPRAELGADVTVGPLAYVEDGVVIGAGTVIGPHACVLRHTTVGPGCRIHAGAVLGDLPQDLACKGTPSYVKIGANCVIREGVTIHRGTKPETATEVGDNCFLMVNSHLAHNVRLGNQVILANGVLCGGYAEVGDRAFLSGNCLVHQFTRIGALAMMGGASGVSKDVPPFCTVESMTTNRVLGLNVVGMRRAGMDPATRREVKEAFTILYRSGLNVSQAVEKMRSTLHGAPATQLCDFIESSKRGICGLSRGPHAIDRHDGAEEE